MINITTQSIRWYYITKETIFMCEKILLLHKLNLIKLTSLVYEQLELHN